MRCDRVWPETDLWEVLSGMGTTRLLTSGSSGDGLDGALEKVAELEGLHKVTICTSALRCPSRLRVTHEFQIMLLSLIPTSANEL